MICRKLEECIANEFADKLVMECDNAHKETCIKASDTRPEVKCEENRKKYILRNELKKHVVLMQMDGGVILPDRSVPDGTAKCDFLYVIGSEKECSILTELKGTDVRKALSQISGVLALYKDFFAGFEHVYARAVVTSSTPNLITDPKYTNLAKTIQGKYHGNIKIVERQFEEKYTELDKK